MKFTLLWLRDHLRTDSSLDEIVSTLTMIGLEVESVDDGSRFSDFVVARVESSSPHPDADKLRVLMVDKGDGNLVQVVCGAPNAREGLIGVFAAPGMYIPGIDLTLKKAKIRGVESAGMMCSERELEISDEHDGIIDLPSDAPVGSSYSDYAGLSDPVIEIAITPNRSDALGVSGIARDLAAAGLGEVITPDVPATEGSYDCPVSVDLSSEGAADFCPAFGLRLIKGVKNGESPLWLRRRLEAIGLRPISALVDVTNYITFDRGRPLHVFDADKVAGNLAVRAAKDGEKFMGLDDKEYNLSSSHFVIADDNGAESLAGIMGGLDTGCSESTTNVLLESALWDPSTIARTGRDLGIITDARYRFERGVDSSGVELGLELGTSLILEFCGGDASRTTISVGTTPPENHINFPLSEPRRLTGIDIDSSRIREILASLGFGIDDSSSPDSLTVTVPSFRPDVHGKADLVEEVIRIYGVNEITSEPLPSLGSVNKRILTTEQSRVRRVRRTLASRGMSEAVCYSFIPHSDAVLFGGGDDSLRLTNPIASDMSDMRPSLLPGLLSAAKRNVDRGFSDLSLFEVGHIWDGLEPENQHRVASGIRRGYSRLDSVGRHWSGAPESVTLFDAKEDALSVLVSCGVDTNAIRIEPRGPDWYHPGRSAYLKLGAKIILGSFGEFHPAVLDALDVTGPLCGFEVSLGSIPVPRRRRLNRGALRLYSLQPVRRDFSFIVDSSVSANEIRGAVMGANPKVITDAYIFDLYEGESVGESKKAVGVEVTLQPVERAFTDDEIDATSKKIIESVSSSTGGVLRG